MSWNISGLLVYGLDSPQELLRLLKLQPTGEDFEFEEATSTDDETRISLASMGRRHYLADCTYEFGYTALSEPGSPAETALLELSLQSSILAFVVAGVSDVYGFCLYREGKVVRRWLCSEDELNFADGPPLPEEKGAFQEEPDDVDDGVMTEFLDRAGMLWEFDDCRFVGLKTGGA